ncbi:MAG: ABC transporter substrate-binding protein, partial [Promethearchaeota archaeon]
DTWDDASSNVQRQVIQGLVQYNLSTHPKYEIMGVLATDWRWHGIGAKEISFKLREGVRFHDGETFDADDVIWNLDRLTFFCNYTGDLRDNSTSWLGFPSSLYYFNNGKTPIIANYYKNSKYNITIELNKDFAPFLDLLTLVPSYILSPKSTPKYRYLNWINDKLIGTGPFIYDHFLVDSEVRFHRNDNYWGNPPWIKTLIFDINKDDISRNMDMLALKVDYLHNKYLQSPLSDMLSTFNLSSYHTLYQLKEGLCYFFLDFNCGDPTDPRLNVTWRKALQFTINYTQILEDIYQGYNLIRSLPLPGYNASVSLITQNITKARLMMQSMGFGYDGPGKTNPWDTNYPGSDEAKWQSAEFKSLDIYYSIGDWDLSRHSSIHNDKLEELLKNSFELIGIYFQKIFYLEGYGDYNSCDLWSHGWCSDFIDAYNILGSLFDNVSIDNFARVNDPYLQSLLQQALKETNVYARNQIYQHIQSYLFDINTNDHEWKYPHVPLFTSTKYIVHNSALKGICYNVLNILDCWNWYEE